jgi:AAA ATPase domain
MLLRSITLRNLLSFKDTSLQLGPLNVLIGPNGSGKSNLIEAISLLQAVPVDLNRSLCKAEGFMDGFGMAWMPSLGNKYLELISLCRSYRHVCARFHFFCRFTGTARLWRRDEESGELPGCRLSGSAVEEMEVDRSAYAPTLRCEPCVPATAPASVA